jgi:hypothetical protein
MYKVRSNADMQECVCEIGRCGRTNAGEFERKLVFTVECKRYVRTHVQIYIYFFYTKIFTNTKQNNYKYLHTEISTPPPNLKLHIAHNVTELTKPKGWVNSGLT